MMPNPKPEQRVLHAFTSEQWSGRPAKDGGNIFVGSAIIGAVLCLVLMIFVPGLRSGGAFTLFTAAFAVLFTVLAIKGKASAERKFLAALTATLNDTIVGLTGNIEHRLSAQQFRALIENGAPLPLPVNGVPGLELQAIREKPAVQLRNAAGKRADNVAQATRIVITATPPDYGITSFDHLLAAAVEADGSNGGGVP
ncbi:hypothetical protein NG697_00840 [Pseudarthrobacter sp. MDT3-26]|uniref:hypothetical protein n=1 Tax=Pseudarthrobacter raffinosi TaxID=2953651 RepID=UPI00208FF4D9|nr:hypothetical protein [Pseudarthrobacter sp. MDT3-26]MCO4261499.1 hypothetical protein [Pseudarthrobacter sp. MDT3-26]